MERPFACSSLKPPYYGAARIGYQQPVPRKTKKKIKAEAERRSRPVVKSRLQDKARWDRVMKKTWEPFKPTIERLYLDEGYSVRVVLEIMWCLYQFGVRSESKYNKKLAEWNMQKNQKATDPGDASMSSDPIPENQEHTEHGAPSSGIIPEDQTPTEQGNAPSSGTIPKESQGRKRTRGQRKPESPGQHITGDTSLSVLYEFDFHRHTDSEAPQTSLQLQPNMFLCHERVLHSVDSFIHGIFGSRKKSWSADTLGFVNGDGTRCPLTEIWRDISDQCHSVTVLVCSNLPDKAETSLDQLLQGLGDLFSQPHPALIAQFWRICLRLLSMDCHIPQAKPVDRLFALLLQSQTSTTNTSTNDNSPNPIQLLVDSLRRIDRSQLKDVLRIGYVKTILTLTQLIGDENVIALEMLTFYCRFFATRYLARQVRLLHHLAIQ